jgi:hypothetical protein
MNIEQLIKSHNIVNVMRVLNLLGIEFIYDDEGVVCYIKECFNSVFIDEVLNKDYYHVGHSFIISSTLNRIHNNNIWIDENYVAIPDKILHEHNLKIENDKLIKV